MWFNEINYFTFFEDQDWEYVELAGPSAGNIYGWRIEFYDSTGTNMYGSYRITNMVELPSDTTNGFGFYVLGDSSSLHRA